MKDTTTDRTRTFKELELEFYLRAGPVSFEEYRQLMVAMRQEIESRCEQGAEAAEIAANKYWNAEIERTVSLRKEMAESLSDARAHLDRIEALLEELPC